MKTYFECIPCFFNQAIHASKSLNIPDEHLKIVIDKIGENLSEFSLSSSPPEMGKIIHEFIKKELNNDDPYKEIKNNSNRLALNIYPKLKEKIINCKDDPLLLAVKLAIAGNIIDYGAGAALDIDAEIDRILNAESETISHEDTNIFNYTLFREELIKSKTILYLGDNAGEIIFDKLFIEEILKHDKSKRIYFAVRSVPILNDVTLDDAFFCGMERLVRIVKSGSALPGTLIKSCTDEFLEIYNKADLIISKGQGNFETLSNQVTRPIFFLLLAKCPVVARDIGCNIRDVILLRSQ